MEGEKEKMEEEEEQQEEKKDERKRRKRKEGVESTMLESFWLSTSTEWMNQCCGSETQEQVTDLKDHL